MANTKLQFKRTTVSGRLPNTTISANTSYIDAGEFAINLADGKVVSSNGTVTFEVGANLSSLNVASSIAVGVATINSTIYSATANNANNLGGTSLATLQGEITGNASTAYTNATIYSANASNLGNGTVAPARLGSGTANSTTVLYGNGVFAAAPVPGGANTIITTGNGSNQSITLSSNTIVANDIIVTFNGLRQTPNSYIVTTGTLYVTAPANSDIVVQLAGGIQGAAGAATPAGGNTIITTGNGSNQSITLSSNVIVANDIIVTFNGLRQTPNSYIVTTGTLYVTAPANSDIVVQLAGGPTGATGAAGVGITANATAISAISVGNSTVNTTINATSLTSASSIFIGTTTIPSQGSPKLIVQGNISGGLTYTINSSTAITIAEGAAFLCVIRNNTYGGAAVVLYETGVTPIIISTTTSGTTFQTSAPNSSGQVQLADKPGNLGITALANADRNNSVLSITVIQTNS